MHTVWSPMILEKLHRDKLVFQRHRMSESGPHDHCFLELTYIVSGPVLHTRDGHTDLLTAGDYFIVDYGSVHSYVAPEDKKFENLDCLFLPELLDPVLRGTKSLRTCLEHYLLRFQLHALVKNPAGAVFHDDDGRVRDLLLRMEREASRREAGYLEFLRCYLLEILLLTLRKIEGAERPAATDGIGAYIGQYVEEHYREDISLSSLADALHYTLPYVSRRFREDTGTSFVNYLQNYRVMQGCRLLSSTEYTVAQIAEMVGYRDVKFFASLVRRYTGLSPAAFRRREQG